MEHECTWDKRDIERIITERDGIRETDLVTHPSCQCGRRQPTRRSTPRTPIERQRESTRPSRIGRTEGTVATARSLLANGNESVSWTGCRSRLIRDHTDVEMEDFLEQLLRAGWIRTIARRKNGRWSLSRVEILARDQLDEFIAPGHKAAMTEAIQDALQNLPPTPAAAALQEHLQRGAPGWQPETIRWAARLVHHAAIGKQLLVRQFSAAWGLSKEFENQRLAIERILGDVTELGISDTASLLYVGGSGRLTLPDTTIDLSPAVGILGLERATLHELKSVHAGTIAFIENKTVFEAVAKSLVPDLAGCLAIFTGGNVGPAIRHAASVSEGRILVWADLDPEGVRIARHIHEASGKRAMPYRMTPEELDASTHILEGNRLRTLDQELAVEGILRDLLEAIQRTSKWREQETQILGHESSLSQEDEPE